jgi:hypothetical protein
MCATALFPHSMNTHLRLGLALALLLIVAVTALRARDASAPAGKNAGGAKMLTPAQALAEAHAGLHRL